MTTTKTTGAYTAEQQLVALCIRQCLNNAIGQPKIPGDNARQGEIFGLMTMAVRYSVTMAEELRPGFYTLTGAPDMALMGLCEQSRKIEAALKADAQ